jgi:hypothetical protein
VRVQGIVGEKEAKKLISSALVIISGGANDFGFNFYDIPTRRFEFNISGYQDFLQNKLHIFIEVIRLLSLLHAILLGSVFIKLQPLTPFRPLPMMA